MNLPLEARLVEIGAYTAAVLGSIYGGAWWLWPIAFFCSVTLRSTAKTLTQKPRRKKR